MPKEGTKAEKINYYLEQVKFPSDPRLLLNRTALSDFLLNIRLEALIRFVEERPGVASFGAYFEDFLLSELQSLVHSQKEADKKPKLVVPHPVES